MIKAVYPGTFDPLTRGHEDIVRRAAGLVNELVVGVADSRGKHPFFTLAERIEMARAVLTPYANVSVHGFHGLLRDFAGLTVLRYEDTKGEAEWAPGRQSHIIRFVGEKAR